MFIILSDHMLVSDIMCWRMAWHAICWYMCSYLVAI